MSDTAQWITLFTVIAGFVFQFVRENRQRKWEKEDRAALANTVAQSAEKVAATVASTAAKVASTVAEGNASLGEKIDVNTEISTKAFKEANSVNLKIESLGLEHNQLQRERQQQADEK